jgi:hypothetical protein
LSTPSTSEVHIANRALAQLNEGPISNIENPTTSMEVLVASMFADVRQELLRGYLFKARATIPKISGTTPTFDFDSFYQLPNNWLRFLSIEGSREEDQDFEYDIEDGKVAYNSTANSIKVRYIQDVTDISKWDALFKKCMVLSLAIELVGATSQKSTTQLVSTLDARLSQAIREANAIDGQERPPLLIDRSGTLTSRRSIASIDYDNRFINF